MGRHALVGRARFWTPLRVVLLYAVLVLALGWLVKAPCIQQTLGPNGHLTLDWSAGRQYVAMCYSDVVTLYGDHRLTGGLPYATHWNAADPSGGPERVQYMDYPVVTGFFLWLTARVAVRYEELSSAVGVLPTGLPEVVFFDLVAGLLAAAWLVVVWLVHRSRPNRPWDAALVALSPLALLHVFTGTDALAVAAAAGGLYLFGRRRPGWAGVLLGVAAATKLYAALLLVPLLLIGWRRRRDARAAGSRAPDMLTRRTALVAVFTWLVVNLPIAVPYTYGWLETLRVGLNATAAPDSLYFVLSYFTGWPGFDGELLPGEVPFRLNQVMLALIVLCCVALAVLVWRSPAPPRLAGMCFLMVAALLLVNKSWSPQFSLWLVPLAVLALPRWRLLLTWMTIDALIWVPRMFYYLGVENKGLPPDFFLAAVLVRDAVVIALMALVVRATLRPPPTPDPDWPSPIQSLQHADSVGSAC
ncbi:glycosyltransferase 87 family protein [Pseudonocardia eucalypti]|uniref:Glycosyltransferase 87 family protein n=1 Tax=Pseudonocardia eucalypti TaxID=648755 RepID=A0ABP9PD17_9PSEU